jgi:TolB-like protein/tRNA A-37 threonylcarbamoyl transferase component Bud32/Flp pilus assembly protein TadD
MLDKTLSHYRILEKLGAGGMGVVYLAEDLRLGRRVALKFLPEGVSADPQALERLKREARAASSLEHPNICTIHDIDEADGRPFIVMELLEGETLRDYISSHRPNFDRLLEISIQIVDALDAAHSRGVVHRDIKPGNILITRRGQAKLMDFGLAKWVPGSGPEENDVSALATAIEPEHLTESGATLGTVAYMSPEQARGEPLDARSDLFSFGAVLYEISTGKQAFGGSTTAVVFDAILNRAPTAPVRLNPELPAELERILNKALEKDRDLRYQSAAEMLADLKRLRRDSSAPRPAVAETVPEKRVRRRPSPGILLGAAALIAALAAGAWLLRARSTGRTSAAPLTLAVLPFRNLGAPGAQDYLAIAIPDEITTTLANVPKLSVRPFSQTQKYSGPAADPQQAGRELRVSGVLAGHFVRTGSQLQVTMEAIDVDENRLLWRDSVSAASDDLIGLREQIQATLRRGLMPKLGAAANVPESSPPRNAEAYSAYLRSAAISRDPGPNREALALLEKSVALDPNFAPAWHALGLRYYYESTYGGGGAVPYGKARSAYERSLAVDPNQIDAASNLAILKTEAGDFETAYDDAMALVRRRPDSPEAHHTLGYVLRYAGLLEEAARECDVSMSLDPTNYRWRSCALNFLLLGRYERAKQFIALDAGSMWANDVTACALLRENKPEDALRTAVLVSEGWEILGKQMRLVERFLRKAPETELASAENALVESAASIRDCEPHYWIASIMGYCQRREGALRQLQIAVEGGFACYQAMDRDPLLAGIRSAPAFARIRAIAVERQNRFLEHRARTGKRS